MPAAAAPTPLYLPWTAGTEWRVSQGNNGTTSHFCSGSWVGDCFAYDFDLNIDQEVRAAAPGKIRDIKRDVNAQGASLGYGNYVIVEHPDGTCTRYGHLKFGTVTSREKGADVGQADVLGVVGNTGHTLPIGRGHHLHFARETCATGISVQTGFVETGGAALVEGQRYVSANLPKPAPPVGRATDVVFVIDTTGSMFDDIDAVKRSVTRIVNSATGDFRVAVVDYKDHPVPPYGGSGDYPARMVLDFSNNKASVAGAINSLSAGGGGDTPESVYSGIVKGLSLRWRTTATRSIIWMGDAPPHDPEPFTNLTFLKVAAAALSKGTAVLPGGTALARTSAEEGTARAAVAAEDEFLNSVQIYAVEIGGAGGPIYEELANATGGRHFAPPTADDVVGAILEAIKRIAGLEPVPFDLMMQAGSTQLQATGRPEGDGTVGTVVGTIRGVPIPPTPIREAGLTTIEADPGLVVRFVSGGQDREIRVHRQTSGPATIEFCDPSGCTVGAGVANIGTPLGSSTPEAPVSASAPVPTSATPTTPTSKPATASGPPGGPGTDGSAAPVLSPPTSPPVPTTIAIPPSTATPVMAPPPSLTAPVSTARRTTTSLTSRR